MDDDTLSTIQAARLLGVATNTVQSWADAEILCATRGASGRRIERASVEAMLATRRAAIGARPDGEEIPTLTSSEAAKRLNVSVRTTQAWVDAGILSAWTLPGGRRRITVASVEACLQKMATGERWDGPLIRPNNS